MKAVFLSLMAVGLLTSFSAHAGDRLIVVTGQSEKSIDPNLIRLNVEVWAKAPTAKQAQTQVATQFKQFKKTLDTFGVKREDTQTEQYSLNPDYVFDQKTQQNKMTGFRVTHNVNVTLRKIDEAGAFLDALISDKKTTDSGVSLNSISWDSDNKAPAESAALAEAVKSARSKADEIAKAAGVRISNVSRISHTPSSSGAPVPMRTFAMKAAMDSASTELSGGQIKVRVEVTAEYEIN